MLFTVYLWLVCAKANETLQKLNAADAQTCRKKRQSSQSVARSLNTKTIKCAKPELLYHNEVNYTFLLELHL